MNLLSVSNLSVALRGRDVLRDVSFSLGEGELVGLIGPNGAGKTTLMRAALGLLPCKGESSLASLPQDARAKQAAWLPQAREIAWPVTVETVVMLGRIPHLSSVQKPSDADLAAVDEALAQMDLLAMRTRPATQISGGEQARVLIARTIAQNTPLLIADEPAAGLDPAHQIATMQSFKALTGTGKSCLVSLHDLGLAARHCTRIIMLSDGHVAADGPPDQVLTQARVADVFGISAWYQDTAQGPVFQPLDVVT
ncbi:MAG: ABC transporter ATP-binding protein [Pseudomonadota bacterium]